MEYEDIGTIEPMPNATTETFDLWRFFFTRHPSWFGKTTSVEVSPPYRTGHGIVLFGVVFGFWWGRAKSDDEGLAHSVGLTEKNVDPWEIGQW